MTKQALNKYVCRLKKSGIIKKVGYATYETSKPLDLYPGVTTTRVCSKGLPSIGNIGVKSDMVRLHNIVFKLKVESPLSWSSRLKSGDLVFKTLKNGVLSFNFDNFTVWLCKSSVVVYFNSGVDFVADTINEALKLGVNAFFNLLPVLEEVLKVSLRHNERYVWSLDRKHLSLVKNALASDYNLRKEKLRVYDTKGCWLVVDDSYNLNELELVRSATNKTEAERVQAFFNDLKSGQLILLSDLYNLITALTTANVVMTKNIAYLMNKSEGQE
jgi:hypothetical protein